MVYDFIAIENDKNTLSNIENKLLSIKTFDYDGQKFKAKEAGLLIPKIEKENEDLKAKITNNDSTIYAYFYHQAKGKGLETALKSKYINFFNCDKEYDKKLELYYSLINESDFIRNITPIEQIKSNLSKLHKLEIELKKEIQILLESEICKPEITQPIKESFDMYLKEDWVYFSKDKYIDSELEILFKALHNFGYLISREYFLIKRNLLEYQCELL